VSPALKGDLKRLRTLTSGFFATSFVPPGGEEEAIAGFVDRRLAERPEYVGRIRDRMQRILGGAGVQLDFDLTALQYCRRTLEEQWGHWRALHRGGWAIETEVEGQEHLEEAHAAGKGAILWGMSFCGYLVPKIALHRVGANLIHLSAADHGAHFPPTRLGLAVVGPLYCRAENRYLAERVIIPADKSQGYLGILEARLAQDRNVWIFGERVGRRRNIEAQLFGLEARFATGSPTLAFTTGARLLPVDVVREKCLRYRLRIDRPILHRGEDREAFIGAAGTEFARRLEERIREHPADWMWEAHTIHQLLRQGR
jgi:hypothetical protein